ncbi:LuxR C-terminal-related transcriptional regulator [Herbiconiux ginsengi]|uniref:LuxR C-terminal-related transcriptional regulator n=1 Tax=Herbiconiux ginsengi TaxID=381665 RepID=UPI0024820A80|nr:LuxR C-terminal-related transcriptional regulator [Herbiconiux ginsengi]
MPGAEFAFLPRLPASIVSRPRLLQRLAEYDGHPLLIVRGPGGSGKTTLLASWALQQPGPGVWVTVDASSRSRVAFWQRVVAAIVTAGLPPDGAPLRETVVTFESTPSLRTMLLRGFTALPETITVVLDDYDEVTDTEVHDDIHWLLRSGAKLRIAIGTRVAGALEDLEHVARVDTGIVLAPELPLSQEEVAQAADALGVADTAAVPEILAAFGGWALPTRAALLELALGRATSVNDAVARVERSGGFVLDPSDADYEAFLLRCSVARRLTQALAVELGGSDAERLLARAERDGLGTWSTQTEPEFVLNPFFRQQLEATLVTRLPDEVPVLRATYARDRADHGDPLEATRQYAAIGDLGQIVVLVRRFFNDLLLTHVEEFVKILRAVDQAELSRHPELLVMIMLRTYAKPGEPRLSLLHMASLAISAARARLGRGKPVDRISILLAILGAQRAAGHYDPALKTAAQLASTLAVLDRPSQEALAGMLPSAWVQLATTFFYAGDLTRAAELLHVAARVAEERDRAWNTVHAASMQTLVLAVGGDMTATRSALEKAEAVRRPQGWRGTYSSAGHHLGASYLALERFDTAAARRELAELARHELTIEHWALIANLRAIAALVAGTPNLGLTTLDRDLAAHAGRPPTSRAVSAMLAATRTDLLIADHQLRRAAGAASRERPYPSTHLARARLELFTGGFHRAAGTAARVAWSENPHPRAKAEAMLIVASASHRLGNTADAVEALERALELLDAFELRRPLIGIPRSDLEALLERLGINRSGFLSGVPDVFPEPTDDWTLTRAQIRVLKALEHTGRIDELAATLHVSTNTVKSHLTNIYRKLGVRSRPEALATARIHGILRDDSER